MEGRKKERKEERKKERLGFTGKYNLCFGSSVPDMEEGPYKIYEVCETCAYRCQGRGFMEKHRVKGRVITN
jgi:hypothetical protein